MDGINPSVLNSSFNDTSTGARQELLISYSERIFIAACFLLIPIFGITENSLVLMAVLLSRKLRTATNVFVVSLATGDMFTSLFAVWDVVALLGPDGWPLPNAHWLCVTGGFVIYTCTGTSIYTLAAIALNRLVCITQPLERYQKIFKPLHLAIMVAFTWLLPFAVFLTLPLVGVGGFGYEENQRTCGKLLQHPKSETFSRVVTITFYPIPLVTIIVCYILIFHHVRCHFKKQRQNEEINKVKFAPSSSVVLNPLGSSSVTTDSLEAAIMTNNKSTGSKRITRNEVDITKNLLLVVCVFFLFLSPYFVAAVISASGRFFYYAGIIMLANSTINPVIYARRHPRFKKVLGCMIRCRFADIPEPSGFLRGFLKRQRRHITGLITETVNNVEIDSTKTYK